MIEFDRERDSGAGSRLRVCVDARFTPAAAGGVAQFVTGLLTGLLRTKGDEELYVLVTHGMDEWVSNIVQGRARLLYSGGARSGAAWRSGLAKRLPRLRNTYRDLRWLALDRYRPLPVSDGTIELAGIDVMHFATQMGFQTQMRTIYHPHDLQHLHLPDFFTRAEHAERERRYRELAARADVVAVASSWVKGDVVRQYGVPDDRVHVVPLAPPTGAIETVTEEQIASTRRQFLLPATFAFFPAQTWPHKNHLALLDALAILRDVHGIVVPLVCSGHQNEYFGVIERRVRELRLASVQFLGYVTPAQIESLYQLSRVVVIPTKYEAASFPIWEAFLAGVPVACSNVTSLPRQVGDAALVFDPTRPDEIAEALRRLWTDEALRRTLVERGKQRVAEFSWDRTARHFRVLYRKLGGRSLSVEDQTILAAPPLL